MRDSGVMPLLAGFSAPRKLVVPVQRYGFTGLSGLAAWECRVVMSDLSGQAALDRVYLLRVFGFPAWLGMPNAGLLSGPGVGPRTLRVVPGILAHRPLPGKGGPEDPEGLGAQCRFVSRPDRLLGKLPVLGPLFPQLPCPGGRNSARCGGSQSHAWSCARFAARL